MRACIFRGTNRELLWTKRRCRLKRKMECGCCGWNGEPSKLSGIVCPKCGMGGLRLWACDKKWSQPVAKRKDKGAKK